MQQLRYPSRLFCSLICRLCLSPLIMSCNCNKCTYNTHSCTGSIRFEQGSVLHSPETLTPAHRRRFTDTLFEGVFRPFVSCMYVLSYLTARVAC